MRLPLFQNVTVQKLRVTRYWLLLSSNFSNIRTTGISMSGNFGGALRGTKHTEPHYQPTLAHIGGDVSVVPDPYLH